MSLFKKLASRGSTIMREWHDTENLTEGNRLMIAEVGATTILNLCGEEMKNWTIQEREEKVNAIRIALTSMFQIGKSAAKIKNRKRKEV